MAWSDRIDARVGRHPLRRGSHRRRGPMQSPARAAGSNPDIASECAVRGGAPSCSFRLCPFSLPGSRFVILFPFSVKPWWVSQLGVRSVPPLWLGAFALDAQPGVLFASTIPTKASGMPGLKTNENRYLSVSWFIDRNKMLTSLKRFAYVNVFQKAFLQSPIKGLSENSGAVPPARETP